MWPGLYSGQARQAIVVLCCVVLCCVVLCCVVLCCVVLCCVVLCCCVVVVVDWHLVTTSLSIWNVIMNVVEAIPVTVLTLQVFTMTHRLVLSNHHVNQYKVDHKCCLVMFEHFGILYFFD